MHGWILNWTNFDANQPNWLRGLGRKSVGRRWGRSILGFLHVLRMNRGLGFEKIGASHKIRAGKLAPKVPASGRPQWEASGGRPEVATQGWWLVVVVMVVVAVDRNGANRRLLVAARVSRLARFFLWEIQREKKISKAAPWKQKNSKEKGLCNG